MYAGVLYSKRLKGDDLRRKIINPYVTVKDSKVDYTVKYSSGRKNTGKYTVTITFKGEYECTKKLTYNILPSKTSKKTYYFKVKAYKNVGDTVVYGALSSVKSMKIK